MAKTLRAVALPDEADQREHKPVDKRGAGDRNRPRPVNERPHREAGSKNERRPDAEEQQRGDDDDRIDREVENLAEVHSSDELRCGAIVLGLLFRRFWVGNDARC